MRLAQIPMDPAMDWKRDGHLVLKFLEKQQSKQSCFAGFALDRSLFLLHVSSDPARRSCMLSDQCQHREKSNTTNATMKSLLAKS